MPENQKQLVTLQSHQLPCWEDCMHLTCLTYVYIRFCHTFEWYDMERPSSHLLFSLYAQAFRQVCIPRKHKLQGGYSMVYHSKVWNNCFISCHKKYSGQHNFCIVQSRLLPNRSPAAWGTQESPLGSYIFAAAPKTLPVGLLTFWLLPFWAPWNIC